MNILFIHQSFPGQFKHLVPSLVEKGHNVLGMSFSNKNNDTFEGSKIIFYKPSRGSTKDVHPWVSDFETKVIRAEACLRRAIELKDSGFYPELIIAHHGWGESLFLKQLWPKAKLGIYCEFFYLIEGADVGFDPEFPPEDVGERYRIMLKNINNIMHFQNADAGISPTYWQASTFPEPFRSKISIIHDGIDTEKLVPNAKVKLILNGTLALTKQDEVITFVNRNLEPYRGYHIFMRSLPEIMKARPNANILIIGGDQVSYGAKPKNNESWKNIFFNEIRPQLTEDQLSRIFFLGNIAYSDFISVLQLSTVHVYLTYPFVLSWSLLEAMSVGCAIVASDTKPLHEVIVQNENGRLVDFFDFNKLSKDICYLLENSDERIRLGKNARNFIRENYDLKNVCLPNQLEWIDSLLKINNEN